MISLPIAPSAGTAAAILPDSSQLASRTDAGNNAGPTFSSILKKTVAEGEPTAVHPKQADKDPKQRSQAGSASAQEATLLTLLPTSTPLAADTRSWKLALPRQQNAAAEKKDDVASGKTAPVLVTDQKTSPAPAAATASKPVAFGVTLQKQSTDAKATASPAVAATSATGTDNKHSAGKQDHSAHDSSSDAGSTSSFPAPKDSAAQTAVTPQPAVTTSHTVLQPVSAPPVPHAYSVPSRPTAEPAAPARTSEIADTPQLPAAKPQSITFSTGSGSNEVSVRVAERAGDVEVTVRTGDAALASSLRQHIPELSDRLAQTGVSAEIWSPHGVATAEGSSNSDGAADDSSQRQQQSSAGNGRHPNEQHPQSRNPFQLDGGDGENE